MEVIQHIERELL